MIMSLKKLHEISLETFHNFWNYGPILSMGAQLMSRSNLDNLNNPLERVKDIHFIWKIIKNFLIVVIVIPSPNFYPIPRKPDKSKGMFLIKQSIGTQEDCWYLKNDFDKIIGYGSKRNGLILKWLWKHEAWAKFLAFFYLIRIHLRGSFRGDSRSIKVLCSVVRF